MEIGLWHKLYEVQEDHLCWKDFQVGVRQTKGT